MANDPTQAVHMKVVDAPVLGKLAEIRKFGQPLGSRSLNAS